MKKLSSKNQISPESIRYSIDPQFNRLAEAASSRHRLLRRHESSKRPGGQSGAERKRRLPGSWLILRTQPSGRGSAPALSISEGPALSPRAELEAQGICLNCLICLKTIPVKNPRSRGNCIMKNSHWRIASQDRIVCFFFLEETNKYLVRQSLYALFDVPRLTFNALFLRVGFFLPFALYSLISVLRFFTSIFNLKSSI
jgi:hypothetical protein